LSTESATVAVIDALNDLAVPYMLVGSLATNLYGIPRSSQDADFVIQCETVSVQDIAQRLGSAYLLDPQPTFESVTGTICYHIRLAKPAFHIELFRLSDDPHDQERFRRRRKVEAYERTTYAPTAEDVIITKLRWALHARRRKDTDDLENVLSVQQGNLEWNYIHSWCDQHGTRELLDQIRQQLPPV
jgi:hypothetical protein